MIRTAAFLAVAMLAIPTPASAIDWPTGSTQMLEASTDSIVAKFPAPAWIDSASYDEDRIDGTNLKARWRVLKGFDLVAQRMSAMLTDDAHWELGLFGYLTDVFFDNCGAPRETALDLPEGTATLSLTYALCGNDYGTGNGSMLLGLSRDAGEGIMLDLWYEVPVASFDIGNEATWPMSAADLEATLRALDAMVTVGPKIP